MLKIKEQLIPINTKRRSGTKMSKVGFFVDHDTGNPSSSAQNNVDYFIRSANEMFASAHMFIDDKDAIMCVPCLSNVEKAWHVMYEKTKDNALYGYDSNDIAIGLELCYFPNDKTRTLKAYNNYIEIAAYLCKLHNIVPTKRSGHFEIDPERKTDPNNSLQYIGKKYADMKADILKKYNELYVEVVKPVVIAAPPCHDLIRRAADKSDYFIKIVDEIIADGVKNNTDKKYFGLLLEKIAKLN